MLAGLTNPDSGSINIFGESINLDKVRGRLSFMIEAPYIDGSMSAKNNMQYISAIRGVNDEEKLESILEFVGLSHTGKKHARDFSLGMRQRLGIGMALVSDPDVMILDEPINGLDPEGIVEIRKKLLKLSQERNVAILISSHLLAELYELCTDFTFIYKGKLIESISREELERKCKKHLVLKANNMSALQTLCEKYNLSDVCVVNDELHVFDDISSIEDFSKYIFENGVIITKLVVESESLEDYYLKKVGADN
jgi:ABC-2 type transport system ATP-binding protein